MKEERKEVKMGRKERRTGREQKERNKPGRIKKCKTSLLDLSPEW